MASVSKRTWEYNGKINSAWAVRYTDQGGKRRSKTFAKKKDAGAYCALVVTEVNRGIHTPDSSTVTFGQAIQAWLDDCERRNKIGDGMAGTILFAYRVYSKKHVIPELGGIKLTNRKTITLQDFIDKKAMKYAYKTLRMMVVIMSLTLKFAIRREWLIVNPPQLVLHAGPDAALVDGADPVVILGRLVGDLRPRHLDAGIVVGGVETSEFGDRPLHHGGDLGLVGDIASHADRRPTGSLYLVDGLPQGIVAEIRQGDGRSGAREGPRRGEAHGKRGVVVGLVTATMAGLLYLLSSALESTPVLSVAVLLIGRAVLGGAESFIVTGGVSWGLALVDSGHAGKVIAWVGTAMFAALAFGGPVGAMLFASHGFGAIGAVTVVLPVLVLLLLARAPSPPPPVRKAKSDLGDVIGAVWFPGLGAALSSTGYCAILAFGSLLYARHQWQPVWLGFTAFGAALIAARAVCGHLPDRFGGARIALLFVLVQSAGLFVMGLAPDGLVASLGAALAGLGYSLVYPGLGVEAVRGTSPENCGLAMGIYTAFLDVAMAVGSPALGWVADRDGLSAVFVVSAGVTFCTAGIALRLLSAGRSTE